MTLSQSKEKQHSPAPSQTAALQLQPLPHGFQNVMHSVQVILKRDQLAAA